MAKFLTDILKIEKEADGILETAKKENLKIEYDTEIQKKNIIKNLEEKSKKKITAVEEFEEMKLQEEINILENEKENKIEKLKQIYDENVKDWIKEIMLETFKINIL